MTTDTMNKKERKAKESRIIRKIEGIIIDEGFTRKIHTYSHFRKDYAAFIKLAERSKGDADFILSPLNKTAAINT